MSFQPLYDAYAASHVPPAPEAVLSAMEQFSKRRRIMQGTASGFERMKTCRRALDALDRMGWERSYHQRQFHEVFLRACSRIFWKTEPAGQFQRDHQKILQLNGWTHLAQVSSTPVCPAAVDTLTWWCTGDSGLHTKAVSGDSTQRG
jgi:hypothetical protein